MYVACSWDSDCGLAEFYHPGVQCQGYFKGPELLLDYQVIVDQAGWHNGVTRCLSWCNVLLWFLVHIARFRVSYLCLLYLQSRHYENIDCLLFNLEFPTLGLKIGVNMMASIFILKYSIYMLCVIIWKCANVNMYYVDVLFTEVSVYV